MAATALHLIAYTQHDMPGGGVRSARVALPVSVTITLCIAVLL